MVSISVHFFLWVPPQNEAISVHLCLRSVQNEAVRLVAAEALSLAAPLDPQFAVSAALPFLVDRVPSPELRERHGAMCALGLLLPALREALSRRAFAGEIGGRALNSLQKELGFSIVVQQVYQSGAPHLQCGKRAADERLRIQPSEVTCAVLSVWLCAFPSSNPTQCHQGSLQHPAVLLVPRKELRQLTHRRLPLPLGPGPCGQRLASACGFEWGNGQRQRGGHCGPAWGSQHSREQRRGRKGGVIGSVRGCEDGSGALPALEPGS